MSQDEILKYYDKAIARGVDKAQMFRNIYVQAEKDKEMMLRQERQRRLNAYAAAKEAAERKSLEEREERLNQYERRLNEWRYGEYFTNEERGIYHGFDVGTMAHLDDIHRETLKNMKD